MDDANAEAQLRLKWGEEEQVRQRERFKWDKDEQVRRRDRFDWEKERFQRERGERASEQLHTKRFRYLNLGLQLLTLTVVFAYPILREHYYLEERLQSILVATIRDELSARDERSPVISLDQIQNAVETSVRREFAARITPLPSEATSTFNVGPFQVSGPTGSTLEGLVTAIFKTAAEKGSKTLNDTIKTASDAVDLAQKGFSLVANVVEKTSEGIQKTSEMIRGFLPDKSDEPGRKFPSVIFDQVAFENDQSALTSAAMVSLDKIAAFLKTEPGKSERILIEGHANAVGSPQHNLSLSEERARRVKYYLRDKGVEEERILFYGFGQGYLWLPFFPDHPDNRRVRITTCGEGWGTNRCLAAR